MLDQPLISPNYSGLDDTIKLAGNQTFACPASVGDWLSLRQEITQPDGEPKPAGDQEWSELLRRQCLSIMDDISQFCLDYIEEDSTITVFGGTEEYTE